MDPETTSREILQQSLRVAALTQNYKSDQALPERLRHLVQQVAETFGIDGCVIRRYDGEWLHLLASYGMESLDLVDRLPPNFGISTILIGEKKTIGIDNIAEHPLTERYAREAKGTRFISYAGAPMLVEGEVIGMLGVYTLKRVKRFSELDLGHLQIVANHLAVVLRTEELLVALRKANEELDQRVNSRTIALVTAHEEMREVTSAIAHDLRSPLRAIVGFGDLIVNHPAGLPSEIRPYIDRQRRAAERMAQMLDDLLGLARLGSSDLRVERLDLCRVVEELWRERAPGDAALKMDVSIPVFGDRKLIVRLVQNLIDNSIKFRKATEPLVLRIQAYGGRRPGFLIQDNGIGFASENSSNIFRPFERLTTLAQTSGTGIGLATVRRIVEMHGGSIVACGEEEVGATFRVYLGTPQQN